MALIDVVTYQSDDEEMVGKFPSSDLRIGTQLVVNTSQRAFFVKGGKILDEFESGTYTIKSENIPLLNKLINIPFGGNSPFQSEVWFVNLISKLDNKWGTNTPIQIEDPKYGVIIPVRAFGQFGFKIVNPRVFLESLVGNMENFSTEKIVSYFKGKIISSISSLIGQKMIKDQLSVLELSALIDDISEFCSQKVKTEFIKYGIGIENFYFMSINIPEDDPSVVKLKESKDLAAKVRITGKDIYQMDRSFDVMDKAAQNEGTMGDVMGAGMGIGLGFGVGNQMGNIAGNMNVGQNQQSQNHQSPPPPPNQNLQYYVLINNQQNGPHSLDSIKLLISQGQVNKDTLVWKEGMVDWVNIMEQSDLKLLFGIVPPPPPSQ